ncbi:hypothetical protein B7R21_13340 [Subtercola boreus]|uniref:Uncharacterized protein n=1 Tax=Subtercola boreus TaxID=120213 RepID=A0A3E0VNA8_9MICO|nr:ATP-binding protein [Subtercola boreus]RFA11432.1 hypothetical protein B7R21_13340 [Subtercola boreus]
MTVKVAEERADALLSRPGLFTASASTVFRVPVVLIDGRSGSGKSELATALAARWPGPVTLVRLDDIYPGWDGLDAATTHVHDHILAAAEPRWQRHDWISGLSTEWTPVDPTVPLIVEGAGSLSRANASLATLRIWVELDDATRKERALARDGDTYAPHWERWATQERAFLARENPRSLADVVFTEP